MCIRDSPSTVTVAEFLMDWLPKQCSKHKWAPKTYQSNLALIQNLIIPYIGAVSYTHLIVRKASGSSRRRKSRSSPACRRVSATMIMVRGSPVYKMCIRDSNKPPINI